VLRKHLRTLIRWPHSAASGIAVMKGNRDARCRLP